MDAIKMCERVDSRIRPQAITLAEQVLFMADKLKESKVGLEGQPIVIPYDNGGGQVGIRENPAFSAYEKLLTSYTKSLAALRDILGTGAQEEISALSDLRQKFKVVK